jgi:preprotein translocase subunit SecE
MSIRLESSGKLDSLKWLLAFILFSVGLAANYYFSHIALPIRVIAWIILFALIGCLCAWTSKGRQALVFMYEARNELRRVTWPSRQETVQTTTLVATMVVVAGLLLWGLDALLMLFVSWLTS